LSPDVAGVLHVLGVVPTLVLVYWVWDDRHNPGVKWFLGAMLAAGLWSVLFGLLTAVDSPAITLALHNLYLFTMHVTAACWFLLAYEWSYRSTLSNRALGALLVVPIGLQVLSIVRPSLMFVRSVDADGVLHVSYGVAFVLGQLLYGYVPIVVGTSLWIGEAIASEGKRRRQALTFLVALAILFAATLVDLLGQYRSFLIDVDLIVIGLYASGFLIAYSITKESLLQVGMAARQTIVEEMDDILILLNPDYRIVDVNPSAQRLFGFSADPVGRAVDDALARYPTLVETIVDERDRTTTSLEVDGIEHHFVLSVSPIEYGRGLQRKAVILRDITTLKNREQDLDRLTKILSRVFRHNVRNDLVPIRGYAELIRERGSDEVASFAERILRKSDRLFRQTDKARSIERIIETEQIVTFSLADVAAETAARQRTAFPDARIETDVPDDVAVEAHPELTEAVDELVENAIEHSDRSDPTVDLYADDRGETVVLFVEDDGPGLPATELEVLRSGVETNLQHGIGVGLWLVRWVVDRSHGSLHARATEEGSRIGIELPAVDDE
jgi:PAS domain S-box-containing protein